MRISLFVASLLLICTNVFADQKGPNLERHIDPVARSGMTAGNLDGSATFDRQYIVTYDGSCSAASTDSSNDGVSYQTFKVMSPSGQNMQAEVLLGTLTDSVLFVYCTPFDSMSPTTNLRAWNDDGGVGFASAFVDADGVAMVPNEVYTLVVSGFGPTNLGTFDLALGGDLQFVTGAPAAPAVELPILSWQAVLLLLGGIGIAGILMVRRRQQNV